MSFQIAKMNQHITIKQQSNNHTLQEKLEMISNEHPY